MVRDIYKDEQLQWEAWTFAQTWPVHILNGLVGQDANGNEVPLQNIKSMLSQVEDLGDFSTEEWQMFFETIRSEGI